MKNKSNAAEDYIEKTLHDSDEVAKAIQKGINEALLEHKKLGNPVCESRNGKIVWVQPEDIELTPSSSKK